MGERIFRFAPHEGAELVDVCPICQDEALEYGWLKEGSPTTPLVPIEPRGSLPPLFLVHDLNGEVGRYTELARRLGPDQPLWGLGYTQEH